jgi:hypothetical protein
MAENLKLAKALREAKSFLQGASNAAASNVSAPVDAIAWALRKAGVPVGDTPMGGSDWMRQKGLTAEAPGASGLIGESVGGVAPIVASAKAAQIAKGLLQAGENLAAPATMNPQAGAIVFHGSPHKFEAFDSSKIGTGEGAQAYGHGLYLAESPDVAGSYATNLANRDMANQGRLNAHANAQRLAKLAGDPQYAADDLRFALEANPQHSQEQLLRETLQHLESGSYLRPLENPGSLYKVDLPDEAIAKMLDWDKPLSQQAPEVQAAVQKFNVGRTAFGNEAKGAQIYDKISGDYTGNIAAKKLREAGIPGIRYLDAGSRGQGQGSSNYVVFPGNERLLQILERNGQPLGTK